ncbi:hypothetical protein [Caballeronia sp. SEWSISQ10-4 2]|nr:hypothetical protein [Caballeronia sp. SEWSISQ10-4 2]
MREQERSRPDVANTVDAAADFSGQNPFLVGDAAVSRLRRKTGAI